MNINGGPLRNKRLADILGVQVDALQHNLGKSDYLAYGLRLWRNHGANAQVILPKSRWSHDRRFEFSRALGDAIWSSNEQMGPLAASKTARQKFQRAFAQSLLCPFEDLLSYINTVEPSEADFTAAARYFHVSERVVKTLLVNKSIVARERLSVTNESLLGEQLEDIIEVA